MSHIPPLDPMVAARKGFRESEERLKRFWKEASVAAGEAGGWVVLLDGRAPKTPAHNRFLLPTEAAARMVADEWGAQGEFLDPGTMPATRIAATAIDRVAVTREPVAEEIAAYVGSDLLCYLAEHPTPLVAEQSRAWTPWREWAERELGVVVVATQGIIHRAQPPESIARVRPRAHPAASGGRLRSSRRGAGRRGRLPYPSFRPTAQPPNRPTAQPPNRPTAQSPNRLIAQPPNRPIAQSPNRPIA